MTTGGPSSAWTATSSPPTAATTPSLPLASGVDKVLARLPPRDAWLLTELVSPSVAIILNCTNWREIVAHITGETNAHAQAACVRAACVNLRDAYERIPRAA
jgi:hypothetical protein